MENMMRCLVAAILVLIATNYDIAAADAATFTTFDAGPADTTPLDINDNGVSVGIYQDSSGVRGFRYDHGQVDLITYPGSSEGTYAQGINNAGVIVGHYSTLDDMGNGRAHGFILNGGVFQNIDAPGSVSTFFSDINNNGLIVGASQTAPGGDSTGMLYDGTNFSYLNAPGFASTLLTGVNDAGILTGYASEPYGPLGFYYDGSFHFLAANFIPYGINNSGLIAGIHFNVFGAGDAFLYDPATGSYRIFDDPDGSNGTYGYGISNTNEYVGTFSDGPRSHGFTASNSAAAVPEPKAWGMIVGGVGILGWMMRWRRPRRLELS